MKNKLPVLFALLAALLYGVSVPLSKLLLERLSPFLLAALLYFGAGIGMLGMRLFSNARGNRSAEAHIGKKELPFAGLMVALDIAAPVLLLFGLRQATAASVSLAGNFETAATAVFALLLFREPIGKRLWLAIALITAASVLLSLGDAKNLALSPGMVFALLACACWGLENNCTRALSQKDPQQIVAIKGIGAGAGALLLAACTGELTWEPVSVLFALLLGFASYGISIRLYILAQRNLGAARTGAYYAAAPFLGAALSAALFGQSLTLFFLAALILMAAGGILAVTERHAHVHAHMALTHEHRHSHDDGHHAHAHDVPFSGEHSHVHAHAALTHMHPHTPDIHHAHTH
ncbi:MAG: DMT family transporter [Clostridiaceae bacterium]